MRRRLIAIDLDGTLLSPGGGVSAANVRAVAAAVEAGHRVVIATGRSWLECREAVEALRGSMGDADAVIGAGGAIISGFLDGRTRWRAAIDPELATLASRTFLRHDHPAQLLQDPDAAGVDYLLVGEELDPTMHWWLERYRHRTALHRDLPDAAHLGHTVRVGTILWPERMGEMVAQLREEVGRRLVIHHWAAGPTGDHRAPPPELVEVFAPAVDKWTAILRLCGEWSIDPGEVVAIGDGANDLGMIASAGVGIAMANADPRVLAVAKARTARHDRDGVAEAIAQVLAGRL